MVTAYGYVGTYATPPSNPCLPPRPAPVRSGAMGEWDFLAFRRRLTGTRVELEGQIFVFVCHLERKPAVHGAYPYGMGQWDPGTNGWSALTLNTERSKRSSVTHAASRCS